MIGGDFTTNKDYDLNIWQTNMASVFTVQGESGSRTINFHLKEEVKVKNPRNEMEMQLKPFDATGYSTRLYVEKPDNTSVFFDGMVTDALNGIVSFTLPYQATVVNGEIPCTVYLTKPDGTTLKAIGITLDVQENDLEGAVESTSDFSALVTALNRVDAMEQQVTQALADAQESVSQAQQAIENAEKAVTSATNAAGSANRAADRADMAATNTESLYQMVNPLTGEVDYITNIVNSLTTYIFQDTITAQKLDDLNMTAQSIDNLNISARDWDTIAKILLT